MFCHVVLEHFSTQYGWRSAVGVLSCCIRVFLNSVWMEVCGRHFVMLYKTVSQLSMDGGQR